MRIRYLAFALLLSGTCALLSSMADAIETARIELQGISGEGWTARDVEIELSPLPGRGAQLHAATVTLAGLPGPLRNVHIDCPHFALEARRIGCAKARIDALIPSLGRQQFAAALEYALDTQAVAARIEGLKVAQQGTVQASGTLEGSVWTLELKLRDVPVEALLKLAREWSVQLPALTAAGTMTLDLAVRGSGPNPVQAEFTASLSDLTAANEAGTLASDKLGLSLAGNVARSAAGWDFNLRTRSDRGQVYIDPVFLDFGRHALNAVARGSWPGGGALNLANLRVEHRDVIRATGTAQLDTTAGNPLKQLDVAIERLDFPGAYTSYLQPFLVATEFKELETAGSMAGRIVLKDGSLVRVDFGLDAVSVDDGKGQNALYGLSGAVHWSARGAAPAGNSHLALKGGLLLGLDVGATQFAFRAAARDFELLEPTRIPLVDGALELERFAVRAAGLPEMSFALDANLLPLSVQRLSRAFGWPEFGGQLGGRISDLRLDKGVLTLSTTLVASVFDGRLEISDLRLEEPFGDWPRLYSSIDIYNLDLEQVTSAFSFGRITGRLSGYINELALFNWMPVEFDARLYTPPDDRSRHRISQRAVQNIGNLGGGGTGVGAALSSGFMRFFDEFNYDRLGISCRLQNEVCLMDGVDPAPQGGYYLVKGRGLPRIDVIGNAAQVDWPRLIAQIKAILESEGPVVE